MGKHNGKARRTGAKVGGALSNRSPGLNAHKKAPEAGARHTTQEASVVQNTDLTELMAMAELANQDFSGERQQAVVITGPVAVVAAADRPAPEKFSGDDVEAALKIPRRPKWTASTTADMLHEEERASFLVWRRKKAVLEERGLYLTPFEKNIEVWRQLWRVVERSDIIIQVVDARDPLLYWSTDLQAFAHELDPTKQCYMLINKADLLPAEMRKAWSEYLEREGIPHIFWSAMAASQAMAAVTLAGGSRKMQAEAVKAAKEAEREAAAAAEAAAEAEAAARAVAESEAEIDDGSVKVLEVDALVDLFVANAQEAVAHAPEADPRKADPERRLVVGLVGYPNVGKSSTINTLYGAKKAAVAATPGKTKHFQTLNITPELQIVDCPGLVFPQIAASKQEMVTAGVIPIDQLMDVRIPIDLVANRISPAQFQAVYDIVLGAPNVKELAHNPLWAADQLLATFARSRGWVSGSGEPDKTRAGRYILKDYASGKLLFARWPPGAATAPGQAEGGLRALVPLTEQAAATNEETSTSSAGPSRAVKAAAMEDEEMISTLRMDEQAGGGRPPKPGRAEHKFHKKKKGQKTFVGGAAYV